MDLRLLAVIVAVALGVLVAGWGIAAARRPGLWHPRAVQWCVGWTREPVGRTYGFAVAVFGAGIIVSAVGAAMAPPAEAIPLPARIVELTGLAIVLVGGALMLASHPAPLGDDGLLGTTERSAAGAPGSS